MRRTKWLMFSLMVGLISSSVAESAKLKLKGNIGEVRKCSAACRITKSGGIACYNFLVTDYDLRCVDYIWVSTSCGPRWERVNFFCH